MAALKQPHRKEKAGSIVVEYYEDPRAAWDRAEELERSNPRHQPSVFEARNHHWMADNATFFGVHYNLTRGIR